MDKDKDIISLALQSGYDMSTALRLKRSLQLGEVPDIKIIKPTYDNNNKLLIQRDTW